MTTTLSDIGAPGVVAPPRAHEGVVDALMAVTGIRDDVDDVIVPGAFTRTLGERPFPRVCLGHDWNRPIGKTLAVKELMPGDPALPATTADGSPWPAEAGALWARVQYDLSTKDGRQAFADALFAERKSSYSIGYRTRKARRADGVRHLHDVDLYEYSQVTVPANRFATLQSIKSMGGLSDQEVSVSLEDMEIKARRYVRNAEFWDLPLGTLILPGMKPRGPRARALARAGKPVPENAGTVEIDANEILSIKPTAKGKAKDGPPTRDRPSRHASTFAVQHLVNTIGGAARRGDPIEPTNLITNDLRGEVGKKDTEVDTLDLLIANAITPAELRDDLESADYATGRGATADDENAAARALIPDVIDAYRERYQAELVLQRGKGQADDVPDLDDDEDGDTPESQTEDATESAAPSSLATILALRPYNSGEQGKRGVLDSQRDAIRSLGPEGRDKLRAEINAELDTLDRSGNDAGHVSRYNNLVELLAEAEREPGQNAVDELVAASSRADRAKIMGELDAADLRVAARENDDALALLRRRNRPAEKTETAKRERVAAELAATLDDASQPVDLDTPEVGTPAAPPRVTHPLDPAAYRAARDRAMDNRFRRRDIQDRAKRVEQRNAAIERAEQAAADAPGVLPDTAFGAGASKTAGGRLQLINPGKTSWSIAGLDPKKFIASASSFEDPDNPRRSVKLTRAQADDLADKLAAITDRNGNRIPFTVPSDQWANEWVDAEGRRAQNAIAKVITDWADANGFTVKQHVRDSAEHDYRRPDRYPTPGVADADGFYPGERVRDAQVGDTVRQSGVVGVVTTKIEKPKDYRGNRDTVLTLDNGETISSAYGAPIDLRPAQPLDLDTRNPGMGWSAAPMGVPLDSESIPDAVPAGTRIVFTPERDSYTAEFADNRPRIGTVSDRMTNVEGRWFQVVEYDDGTDDALSLSKLVADGKVVTDPTPEQERDARVAWGLDSTDDEPPSAPEDAPNSGDLGIAQLPANSIVGLAKFASPDDQATALNVVTVLNPRSSQADRATAIGRLTDGGHGDALRRMAMGWPGVPPNTRAEFDGDAAMTSIRRVETGDPTHPLNAVGRVVTVTGHSKRASGARTDDGAVGWDNWGRTGRVTSVTPAMYGKGDDRRPVYIVHVEDPEPNGRNALLPENILVPARDARVTEPPEPDTPEVSPEGEPESEPNETSLPAVRAPGPALSYQQESALRDARPGRVTVRAADLSRSTEDGLVTTAHANTAWPMIRAGLLREGVETGTYLLTPEGERVRDTLGEDPDPDRQPDRSTAAMWRRDPTAARARLTPHRQDQYDALDRAGRVAYARRRADGDDHATALAGTSTPEAPASTEDVSDRLTPEQARDLTDAILAEGIAYHEREIPTAERFADRDDGELRDKLRADLATLEAERTRRAAPPADDAPALGDAPDPGAYREPGPDGMYAVDKMRGRFALGSLGGDRAEIRPLTEVPDDFPTAEEVWRYEEPDRIRVDIYKEKWRFAAGGGGRQLRPWSWVVHRLDADGNQVGAGIVNKGKFATFSRARASVDDQLHRAGIGPRDAAPEVSSPTVATRPYEILVKPTRTRPVARVRYRDTEYDVALDRDNGIVTVTNPAGVTATADIGPDRDGVAGQEVAIRDALARAADQARDTEAPEAPAIDNEATRAQADLDAARVAVTLDGDPLLNAAARTTAVARMAKRDARAAVVNMDTAELRRHDTELTTRAIQLGKPGVVSPAHQAVKDEIARRDTAEPPAPEPQALPVSEPAPDTRIADADLAEIEAARDDSYGLIEAPDGELEVDDDVAARQDRVAALLDADKTGALDVHALPTDDLRRGRADLTDELRLQEEVARRDARRRRDTRPAPASTPTTPVTADEQPEKPRTRPGLAGAAQDHAEALESGDPAAIERTRARLDSSIRRSRAGSDAGRALAEAMRDGTDPDELNRHAAALRAETRERRNTSARNRRLVRRLERDRIRSLIGSIDAELRGRGEAVPADTGEDDGSVVAAATPGGGGPNVETPPTGAAPDETPAPAVDPDRRGSELAASLREAPWMLIDPGMIAGYDADLKREAALKHLGPVAERYAPELERASAADLDEGLARLRDLAPEYPEMANAGNMLAWHIAHKLPDQRKRAFLKNMRDATNGYNRDLSVARRTNSRVAESTLPRVADVAPDRVGHAGRLDLFAPRSMALRPLGQSPFETLDDALGWLESQPDGSPDQVATIRAAGPQALLSNGGGLIAYKGKAKNHARRVVWNIVHSVSGRHVAYMDTDDRLDAGPGKFDGDRPPAQFDLDAPAVRRMVDALERLTSAHGQQIDWTKPEGEVAAQVRAWQDISGDGTLHPPNSGRIDGGATGLLGEAILTGIGDDVRKYAGTGAFGTAIYRVSPRGGLVNGREGSRTLADSLSMLENDLNFGRRRNEYDDRDPEEMREDKETGRIVAEATAKAFGGRPHEAVQLLSARATEVPQRQYRDRARWLSSMADQVAELFSPVTPEPQRLHELREGDHVARVSRGDSTPRVWTLLESPRENDSRDAFTYVDVVRDDGVKGQMRIHRGASASRHFSLDVRYIQEQDDPLGSSALNSWATFPAGKAPTTDDEVIERSRLPLRAFELEGADRDGTVVTEEMIYGPGGWRGETTG